VIRAERALLSTRGPRLRSRQFLVAHTTSLRRGAYPVHPVWNDGSSAPRNAAVGCWLEPAYKAPVVALLVVAKVFCQLEKFKKKKKGLIPRRVRQGRWSFSAADHLSRPVFGTEDVAPDEVTGSSVQPQGISSVEKSQILFEGSYGHE
jgi:hypothetical protein